MAIQDNWDDVISRNNNLKDASDIAIQALNNFAQWNTASSTYTGAGLLFADDKYIPVEAISVADGMIDTVITLADKINSVTFTLPTAIVDYSMQNSVTWDDPLATQINDSLSDYLSTMGIPSKEFQDSIFNENIERNQRNLQDLYDMAEMKAGARGFTYPNSMTTVLKLDAQQKYQFDRTQINRDVTKLVTEWARQNYQFAMQQGINFEQWQSEFTYKFCTASVEIYKTQVMTSIERFKADIGRYVEPIKALIEAAKLPVEVGKINADIAKANAELNLEETKTKIQEAVQVFNTRTQASIATFSQQIAALSAVARETAAFAQSVTTSMIGIQK